MRIRSSLRLLIGADVQPDTNSGAAGTVMETNTALRELGHEVDAFWADSLGRRIAHGNLHYLLELPGAYRREVKRRLEQHSVDVVQLSQPYAYLAGKYVLSRHANTLMIWRSHGLEAKVDAALERHSPDLERAWLTPFRRLAALQRLRVQRAAVRWCDGMLVPCSDDRDFLINHFGANPDRVRVIWHGIPDGYLDSPIVGNADRWRRLLHVSQMSANKGTGVMFQAVIVALEQNPRATMTWVCPSSMHDSIRRSLPERFRARVELNHWVSREKLRGLYDSHGIFVFPTLAEGAAKTVMEAMARGMCVVSSDTSGPRDYIQHGANGMLTPVGDAGQLAQHLTEALLSHERAAQLGESARNTAQAFRWSRCARQMVSFYSELFAARQAEHHSSRSSH